MIPNFNKLLDRIFLYLFCLSVSGLVSLKIKGQANQKSVIEISNPLSVSREELATIPYSKFIAVYPDFKIKPFKLIDILSGKELAYQLEYKGEKGPLNILVQVSCKATSVIKLIAKPGTPAVVKAKTFARFVPERYDDFAWENDRIAFRMYGPALASRPDNAYGIDVWVKRTDNLILNKWYKGGNYHKDNGEGMDYYGVGKTLGAGDIAFYVKDSIVFTNNYTTWKVLDNGPLRSSFQLDYTEKNVAGKLIKITKIITLDAGAYLNKIEAIFTGADTAALPLVIGIAKRKGNGAILFDEQEGIMGYWEPESPGNGITGVGCILPAGGEMKVAKGQLLYLAAMPSAQSFNYYTGAAWNKGGPVNSAIQWFNYLSDFAAKSQRPLLVKIN